MKRGHFVRSVRLSLYVVMGIFVSYKMLSYSSHAYGMCPFLDLGVTFLLESIAQYLKEPVASFLGTEVSPSLLIRHKGRLILGL